MRFCGAFPVRTANGPCGFPKELRRLSRVTIFPAIPANWRTFWSGPPHSPRSRKSSPTTCSSLRRFRSLANREPPMPNGRCRNTWTVFFCFNDTATTEIYTLSLHDALPISRDRILRGQPLADVAAEVGFVDQAHLTRDRKSTRLNSSHVESSYAVFCLK